MKKRWIAILMMVALLLQLVPVLGAETIIYTDGVEGWVLDESITDGTEYSSTFQTVTGMGHGDDSCMYIEFESNASNNGNWGYSNDAVILRNSYRAYDKTNYTLSMWIKGTVAFGSSTYIMMGWTMAGSATDTGMNKWKLNTVTGKNANATFDDWTKVEVKLANTVEHFKIRFQTAVPGLYIDDITLTADNDATGTNLLTNGMNPPAATPTPLPTAIPEPTPKRELETLTEWTPKFYNKNSLAGESAEDGTKRIFKLAKGESYDGSDAMYIRYESAETLQSWGGYQNNSVGAVLNDLSSGVWTWKENTEYQISFVFKTKRIASSTVDPFIKVFFGDWVQNKTNASDKVSTDGLTEAQITDGWKKFSCTYTTTAQIANTEIFNVQMPGEYWIDDISLMKTSDEKELIFNGSFTSYEDGEYYLDVEGIDGWNVIYGQRSADGILENDNGTTRLVRVANGLAPKGHRSLYIKYWSDREPISWDGGKTYDVYQGGITIRNTDFVPEAGKEYTLSYLMRNEGSQKLLFWIGNTKMLSSAVTPTTDGLTVEEVKAGWKRYTHTFTAANTEPFSISVNYINTWHLDDISVVATGETDNLLSPVASDFEAANADGVYAHKAHLFDGDGNEITKLTTAESGKTLIAKATVMNYSKAEGMPVQLITCLYRNGQLEKLSLSEKQTLMVGETALVTAELLLPQVGEDHYVKSFVWSGDGNQKPYNQNGRTRSDVAFGNTIILGDSYSTFEGYIPSGNGSWYKAGGSKETDVADVSQTWWSQLMKVPGNTLLLNESWSGTTVCHTGYDGEDCSHNSFVTRANALIEQNYFTENQVDTIFVFGGTNDSWANVPVGELKYADWTEDDLYASLPAFCYLLDSLKKASPDSQIIYVLGAMLSKEIKQGYYDACKYYGATPVWLTGTDVCNSHPTQKGMTQIKNQIIDAILSK